MSQSGVELAEAVENLASTTQNPKLSETLHGINSALEEGIQLSAALKNYHKFLTKSLCPQSERRKRQEK